MEQEIKKCPFCAEAIQKDAIKCKHCASELLESNGNQPNPYSKSEYAKWIIVSLLLPIIGIIMGIVYMTKPDKRAKKMGESILAWSVLFAILFAILFSFNSSILFF